MAPGPSRSTSNEASLVFVCWLQWTGGVSPRSLGMRRPRGRVSTETWTPISPLPQVNQYICSSVTLKGRCFLNQPVSSYHPDTTMNYTSIMAVLSNHPLVFSTALGKLSVSVSWMQPCYFKWFNFLLVKGKEESPVDMETITLDPEEEVRAGSKNTVQMYPSIYPLSVLLMHMLVSWSQSQLTLGQRRGTPWTLRQLPQGQQSFTSTPTVN